MSDIGGAEDYKKTFKYKAALWSVIILSILIVLALIALVVGAITKFGRGADVPAPAAQAVSQPFNLPEGVRIISSETQGDRLIIRARNGEDDEIYIIDTTNGQLISRLKAAGGQ